MMKPEPEQTEQQIKESSFVSNQQKKKKRKRTRTMIILGAVAVVAAVGIFLLVTNLGKDESTTSVLNYRVTSVSSGEISSTISGSGTLSALEAESVTAAAESTITSVNFQPGDKISAGDVVMTLTSDELESQLESLQDDLSSTRSSLASARQYLTNLNVTATKSGIIKSVLVGVGDVVDDMAYLCRIATDGKMKVVITTVDGMKLYDAVTVQIGDETQDGYVTAISGGNATVVFTDDYYPVGTSATVLNSDGAALGTGTLNVNEYVDVTAAYGQIATVLAKENTKVSKGSTVFTLAQGAPTATYTALKDTETDLLDQISDIEDQLTIKAEYDCELTSLSVTAGDTVSAGTALCTLTGTSGYTLALSIDELDIASVKLGQNATITLDALDGEFTGTVTNISYSGSGSYVTSYTATITTEPIDGAYPGMSASVEVITETSGETMIVSVSAVQYEGDTAYVLLAGDDASNGDTLSANEIDLDSLTRVTVTTGMSDGSYIAISGEGLSAGSLIWMPERTTTATYSDDEETTTTFTMGGMSGGQMPTGDFSSGGQMPSGNYGGGQMPSGGTAPNN
jgi:HlyD family secretion protein